MNKTFVDVPKFSQCPSRNCKNESVILEQKVFHFINTKRPYVLRVCSGDHHILQTFNEDEVPVL